MRIGEAAKLRILELCKERRITVNRLSTICGITQSTLNNIVSGRNQSITLSTLQKICDGLDISILDFFQNVYIKRVSSDDEHRSVLWKAHQFAVQTLNEFVI